MPYTVKMEVEISNERIDYLLCAAFEGGSGYWCAPVHVIGEWPEGATYGHEVLTRGGSLKVSPYDGPDITVRPAKLKSALQLMAKKHPKHWADFIAENEDAETGDVFFQLLCFGELVYG